MEVTTFKITKNIRVVEDYLIKQMGMTKKSFHKKAYDDFINSDWKIDKDLLIKDKNNPNYIVRSISEQTHLTSAQKETLKKIAIDNNISMSAVLFQALSDFCLKNADMFPSDMYI